MTRLRLTAALALTLCLPACSGGKQLYRPGDDPLVLAHFEHYLVSEGISYRRDYEGNFRAVQPANTGRMEDLGERALAIDPGRESVQVAPGCPEERLVRFLQDSGVIFVRQQEEEGAFLQMTETDYTRNGVAGRYAAIEAECAAEPAQP